MKADVGEKVTMVEEKVGRLGDREHVEVGVK